ncbi:hypothetical protein ABL78_5465 [Leptomonas seymouri]|uniref:Right handed beta helix domain-containing protein n=1 Tax=Leptomonas seymouri TaxID=5684 RepID=A0A0N1I4S0_LEPSE|nr:hypothetical protein ABL78_5465 [Leptomonas seymouri]|eukprot:KPI85472.1 hypothetical protein ABL78_5465 [Leptomonas seymouri]
MQAEAGERVQSASGAPAAAAAFFGDDSSDCWDTVHVTPATAERDLANITVPRCFILHSSTDFIAPPQRTHSAAAAPGCDGKLSPSAVGAASSTPSPHCTAAGLPISKNVRASFLEKDGSNSAERVEDFCTAAGRNPSEVFGGYRRVRMIHNTAPCLVRCATDPGPPPPHLFSSGPSNGSNTVGSASASPSTTPCMTTVFTSTPPSPQQLPQQQPALQCPIDPSSFLTHAVLQAMPEGLVGLRSPLVLPTQQNSPSFSATAMDVGGSRLGGLSGLPPPTPHQLSNLHARAAARRASRVSSRRSHLSLSALPDSAVFLDPLEIIADAAISFVDIVFAAHVSVKGKGTVQFVNCCFGHRTTSQLCQQFISNPPTSDTGLNAKTNSDAAQQNAFPKLAQENTVQVVAATQDGVAESPDGSGPLNGRVAFATRAAERGSPLSSEDRRSSRLNNSSARPLAWGSHLRVEGGSSSGMSGFHTDFALPIAMRMMSVYRRSSLASNALESHTAAEASKGNKGSNCFRGNGSTPPSKTIQSSSATMNAIYDSAATSVLDVHDGSCCVLNQCDLYGGCAGASLVCRDNSRTSVTDSSFDGPSITWVAVEVRDSAEAVIQFTNIQQVMGVGVLVSDHGRATVDSSVIERCGVAGVVATDYGTVSLQNTDVEASVSGVCVALNCSAEAQMVGCGFTTRFLMPRRAAGMMFLEHLQSLGAFRTKGSAGLSSPAQESLCSAVEDPLLQHVLHSDLESLLGLWLLHIDASDTAFSTSSQSLVLCDHAVAVVAECRFTCTMWLPHLSLSSAATNAGGNAAADANNLEESPSCNGSRTNRSDGPMPSFGGLSPAAASVEAVVLSSSDANLSVTNSRGLGSSGHPHSSCNNSNNRPFLLPCSSVMRKFFGVRDEPGTRRSFAHAARRSVATFSESVEGAESDGGVPLSAGLVQLALRSSLKVPTSVDTIAPASSLSPLLSGTGRAVLSSTGTATSSTANDPPSLPNPASCTGNSSTPLPLPVRRVLAGLLSSYVMAREVFGDYVAEKRRMHAAARSPSNIAATDTSPFNESKRTDAGSASNPRRVSLWDKTSTELFLSFEALPDVDNKEDEKCTSAIRLGFTGTRSGTSRRFSNVSIAAMQTLQDGLLQLGCLAVLMAPKGGVYHIVASNQASLVLTSSVLSLVLPPQLAVTLPTPWAPAPSYYFDRVGPLSTIRISTAPFVAAVLDYREPDKTLFHADRPDGDRADKPWAYAKGQPEQTNPFCSIFTRSNVIQYECVPKESSQDDIVTEPPQRDTSAPSTDADAAVSPQESKDTHKGPRSPAASSCCSHGAMGVGTGYGDCYTEAGVSPAACSSPGGSASCSSHNSLRKKGEGPNDAPGGPDARRAVGVAGGSAQLPPRSSFGPASAVQHPQPPLPTSSDTSSSSNAVVFNAAAWGLVLITPKSTRHSEALDAAVRAQAEHWCRIELAASTFPNTAQDGNGEASVSATLTTCREGLQEAPTPLLLPSAKPAGWHPPLRSTNGSLFAGRTSIMNVTDDAKLGSGDHAEASGAVRRGVPSAGEAAETQNAQVNRSGSALLNMTNEAELLRIIHPEHICTTFANFAYAMELPAAQEYPVFHSQGWFSPNPAPAAPSLHKTNTAAVGAATSGSAAAQAATGLEVRAGGNDAPLGLRRPIVAAGHTATATTVTSTAANDGNSLTTATPTQLAEREISCMHVNADIQRQMLLDIDAPPFLAAVAAAGRDDACSVLSSYDATQAFTASILRSTDRANAGAANISLASSRKSDQSSAAPERIAAAGAASSPKPLPLAVSEGEKSEELQSVKHIKEGKQGTLTPAHRCDVLSQRSRPGLLASPRGGGGDDDSAQFPANTDAVRVPLPPKLSMLDVESIGSFSSTRSSSSSSDSSTCGSSDSIRDCNAGSGNCRQSEKRAEWRLLRKQSTHSSSSSAELKHEPEVREQSGAKERRAAPEEGQAEVPTYTTRTSPSVGTGLLNVESKAPALASPDISVESHRENRDAKAAAKRQCGNRTRGTSGNTRSPLTSAAVRPSTLSSKAAPQSQPHISLAEFQSSPQSPEMPLSARSARSGTPLTNRVESSLLSPLSKPPFPASSSSSTNSSKHDDCDSEHPPRQRSVTRAMTRTQLSSFESSPRWSPDAQHIGLASSLQCNQRDKECKVEAKTTEPSKVIETGAAATAPKSPADAAALDVPAGQGAVPMCMAQQMQVPQKHVAFQPPSTSKPEMCAVDAQLPLLVLPSITKSTTDASDIAQGTSDSRLTQNSSCLNSGSTSSKFRSSPMSHRTPSPSALDTVPSEIVVTESVGSDDSTARRASFQKPPATLPPPPPRLQMHPPVELETEGHAHLTPAEVKRAMAMLAQTGKDKRRKVKTTAPSTESGVQRTRQHPPPPIERIHLQTTAAPTAMTPSPPPSTVAQGVSPHARLRRHSTTTTVELLVAALHSFLGSPLASQVSSSGSVKSSSAAHGNVAPLCESQHDAEGGSAETHGEERRWQEELLRRLQFVHSGNTGNVVQGGVARCRRPFPFQSSTHTSAASQSAFNEVLRRYSEGKVNDWIDEERGEMGNHDDVDADDGALPSSQPGTPTVTYEPWRTTVATCAHCTPRPPPHPYSCTAHATPTIGVLPDLTVGGSEGEQPLRRREVVSLPPLHTLSGCSAMSATSPSSRSPRALHLFQSSFASVPPMVYVEPANAQLETAVVYPPLHASAPFNAVTVTASPNASGGGPPGLYVSGRRQSSRARNSTQPSPPPLPQQKQQTSLIPLRTPSSTHIAHLHEDYMHDQYARAAWDSVVAQSRVQERERQRLTSPQQSAQVGRLYTEPLRSRMQRAAEQAQPTREQLYRQHGCTFTPQINQIQAGKSGAALRHRITNGTRIRPLRNEGASIDSVEVPVSLPSQNTTTISDAAASRSSQRSHRSQRRRLHPR